MLVESFFDEGNLKINKNYQKKKEFWHQRCVYLHVQSHRDAAVHVTRFI